VGRVPASAGFQGSLDDLDLPEVLGLLSTTRKTGVLTVEGRTRGTLVLHEGELTTALADSGPDLCQAVVGAGLVDQAGWARAGDWSRQGLGLADALLVDGVDAGARGLVLWEHAVSSVFELLLPGAERFAFVPGATHPLGARFAFAVDEVLAEAAARTVVWREIAETIPSTAAVLRICLEPPDDPVCLDSGDWRVLARLDGRADVAEVVRQLGMSAFAVCGVLHRLVRRGLVEHVR
jgi:hypothetical protein